MSSVFADVNPSLKIRRQKGSGAQSVALRIFLTNELGPGFWLRRRDTFFAWYEYPVYWDGIRAWWGGAVFEWSLAEHAGRAGCSKLSPGPSCGGPVIVHVTDLE